MSAADMLDDSFPHGTVDGYNRGCRTNHCPAPITCHVFRTRYVGDYAFAKRVDAGWTAAQIAAADEAEQVAAREAEKVARKRERERARRSAKARTAAKKAGRGRPWTDEDLAELRRLTDESVADETIARTLHRSKSSISTKRFELGWAKPARKKPIDHGTYKGYAAGCKKDSPCPAPTSCHEAAKAYWRVMTEAHRQRGIAKEAA